MPASPFLQDAVTVFRLKNLDIPLKKGIEIKADQVPDIPYKYFKRQYDKYDPENEFPNLVRQQYGDPVERAKYKQDPQQRYDNQKRVNAILLEREVTNPLGMSDTYYYYVIHRKKLITTWSRSLGLKKFGYFERGFYLPFYILKHVEKNQKQKFASLVLTVNSENHTDEYNTYIAPVTILNEFFLTNRMPLLINAYGEYVTGFPISIMEEKEKIE